MRVVGYFAYCAVAVVVAQIGSMVLAFVLSFANISIWVAALFGEGLAGQILQVVGNLLFAGIFGFTVAAAVHWFRPTLDSGAQEIAGISAGILGFIFPILTGGFMLFISDLAPEALLPLAEPAALFVVVLAAYAIVGGGVALGLALAIHATRPAPVAGK